MKLLSPTGKVITLKVDQHAARKCYENNLKIRQGTYTIVISDQVIDLEMDLRDDWQDDRPELVGGVKEVEVRGRKFTLGESVEREFETTLKDVLAQNMNAFAWSTSDIPGIDPNFLCHHLSINQQVKSIMQKRRKLDEEKKMAMRAEVQKPVEASHIQKIQYMRWL